MFCHAELRGARYIDDMNRLLDQDTQLDSENVVLQRMWKRLDFIFRERWWAHKVLAPIGAGVLAGSLFTMAITTRWRFSLRTLLFAMAYFALLIGIPFAVLRPRLHQPELRLHLDPPAISFHQHSSRPEGGPGWSYPLVMHTDLLVAMGALLTSALVVYLPRSQRSSDTRPN